MITPRYIKISRVNDLVELEIEGVEERVNLKLELAKALERQLNFFTTDIEYQSAFRSKIEPITIPTQERNSYEW